MASRRLRPLVLAGAALLLALVALAVSPGGAWLRDTGIRVVTDPAGMVDPGPLSRHHAAVDELRDCDACHGLTTSPSDDKCIACHEDIGRRREEGGGWHAGFAATCASCHPDHRGDALVDFDRREFNHALARFVLKGRHLELECAACHRASAQAGGDRMRWQEIEHSTCAACHEDPHTPALGDDCSRCHDENGWSGRTLHFAHERDTAFPLAGAHAKVACAQCHVGAEPGSALASARLRGTPTQCAGCHTDPHLQTLGDDCARCHVEAGWTGDHLRFRHDRDSGFRLEGAHAAVQCIACHVPASASGELASSLLAGTPTECSGCHEDAHAPTLGSDCERCHVTAEWGGRALRFRHDADTAFALTGGHRTLACTACHRSPSPEAPLAAAPLRGTPTACSTCHDDPHAGQFARDCATCHETTGWTGRSIAIDHSAFPLRGRHTAVSCEKCHPPVPPSGSLASAKFVAISHDCSACHEDPHEGTLAPRNCAGCHDERDWTARAFDHQRDARLALDAVHAGLDCARCHDGLRFRPAPTGCAECHVDEAAHLAGGGGLPPDPHAGGVTCADCHETSRAKDDVAAMAARCSRCHAPSYGQLHVERTRRIDGLVLSARAAGGSAPDLVDHLRRLSWHNYLPAEERLRKLATTVPSLR